MARAAVVRQGRKSARGIRPPSRRADWRRARSKTQWSANARWSRDSRGTLQSAAERGHARAQRARELTFGFRQFAMTAEVRHMARAIGCAAAARIGQAAFAER